MRLSFVGHAAAGKDTLSEYVSQKFNLTNVSSGDLVRAYIVEHDLGSIERENVRLIANELRHKYGGDYLVRRAMENHPDELVISGLRAIDEIETFKKLGGTVIAVVASDETRYGFAKKRNRIDDKVSFEEWKMAELGDDNNTDHAMQNVSEVITLADYVIENEGTIEDLYRACDEILKKIK